MACTGRSWLWFLAVGDTGLSDYHPAGHSALPQLTCASLPALSGSLGLGSQTGISYLALLGRHGIQIWPLFMGLGNPWTMHVITWFHSLLTMNEAWWGNRGRERLLNLFKSCTCEQPSCNLSPSWCLCLQVQVQLRKADNSGWETIQWVACLLHKVKDQSSIPRMHVRKMGVVLASVFNPCIEEEEKVRFLGLHMISQPNRLGEFQVNEKNLSQK